MTLAAQWHQEAVSQSRGKIRGRNNHCVWAHRMEEVHYLQSEHEIQKYEAGKEDKLYFYSKN